MQFSWEQRLLYLALGCATGPVLAGLWLTHTAEQWLRTFSVEDPNLWSGQRLPVLEHETLIARQREADPLDTAAQSADKAIG
jgi:hypothetical protein